MIFLKSFPFFICNKYSFLGLLPLNNIDSSDVLSYFFEGATYTMITVVYN
ncbi:hypothetical protein [Fusobacterium pseudoperiodonticum]|nr:hypothetical protein [Fusobacterium pseudoperiodonticum]